VQTTGHGIVGGDNHGQALNRPSAYRNFEFDWQA